MKSRIGFTLLLGLMLSCHLSFQVGGDDETPTGNSPPISWYKLGMVQDLGGPLEPDGSGSDSGSVIFDEGMYRLWYSGFDGTNWRVLYSTSPDGIVWTKYGVVVDLGQPGAMDDDCVMAPNVMRNETGGYKMWYTAQAKTSFGWKIMYATSDDGISWQKYGVVLSTPLSAVGHPNVHIDSNGTYRMWYSEYDMSNWRIKYATSDDGIVWSKHGIAVDIGQPGDPDSAYVYFPVVIVEPDGTYLIYYSASDGTGQYLDISFATSPDGEVGTWQKNGLALPHGGPGDYDSYQAIPTTIRLREDGLHELWYTGYDLYRRRMMMALEIGEVPIHLRTSVVNNNDVLLNWTIHGRAFIDHYLIYRAPYQRSFDFSQWHHNTLYDPDPLGTSWVDADAAGPGSPQEIYYVVRAVYSFGEVGVTSNTAGKWTRHFSSGLNAFSLPLEPFESRNLSWYADDIPSFSYVRWMDSTGRWVTHHRQSGEGTNDITMELGRGYEIFLTSEIRYTFCGYPASMIRFREGLGDSLDFRMGLSARKEGPDIVLTWNNTAEASSYEIYRSSSRGALQDPQLVEIDSVPSTQNSWTDFGVLSVEGEYYYFIVPFSPTGKPGSSTYSVGVYIEEYQSGSDTFGLPLKTAQTQSLDEYCDDIPDVVGMAYLVWSAWKFHSSPMPSAVYNVAVVQGEGYQISSEGSAARYAFVGY